MANNGRPSKYKPEHAKAAAKLCKLGATDAQLADFFEVSVSTINLWKVQHKEFSESLKDGKDERHYDAAHTGLHARVATFPVSRGVKLVT